MVRVLKGLGKHQTPRNPLVFVDLKCSVVWRLGNGTRVRLLHCCCTLLLMAEGRVVTLLKGMCVATPHIGPFPRRGSVMSMASRSKHETIAPKQNAQPRPANHGAISYVFVRIMVKCEPPGARFVAHRHLSDGEELTQVAHEPFERRLVR